jgi:copper chaperone CopZ
MMRQYHQGGDFIMVNTVLTVPKMWADHHVLKVREALVALDGVEDVYASSAWKQVLVKHDPDSLDKTAVIQALAEAGYDVSEDLGLEGAPLSAGDPAWDRLGVRATKTDERDLELSGDFRRY